MHAGWASWEGKLNFQLSTDGAVCMEKRKKSGRKSWEIFSLPLCSLCVACSWDSSAYSSHSSTREMMMMMLVCEENEKYIKEKTYFKQIFVCLFFLSTNKILSYPIYANFFCSLLRLQNRTVDSRNLAVNRKCRAGGGNESWKFLPIDVEFFIKLFHHRIGKFLHCRFSNKKKVHWICSGGSKSTIRNFWTCWMSTNAQLRPNRLFHIWISSTVLSSQKMSTFPLNSSELNLKVW